MSKVVLIGIIQSRAFFGPQLMSLYSESAFVISYLLFIYRSSDCSCLGNRIRHCLASEEKRAAAD